MSKYNTLWAYIHESGKPQLALTFDEIGQIAGVPLDHSFLKYKKELCDYGYSYFNIARICLDFASAPGCCFGNIDISMERKKY